MKPVHLAMSTLLATAACNSAESKPAPNAPAAPATLLAAGESLAPVVDDGHRNQQTWDVAGGPVELAAIQRGDQMVLRALAAGAAFDVTEPVAVGVDNAVVLVDDGTAALLQHRAVLGPSPSSTDYTLSRYTVTRIGWDAAARKPIVGDTWTCDETDDDACLPPAWAEDTAPAGDARAPKTDEARVAVASLLAAIAEGDAASVVATMAPGFELEPSTTHADECRAFSAGPPVATKGTDQRTAAAACLISALAGATPTLTKRLTDKAVTTTIPESNPIDTSLFVARPNEVYVSLAGKQREHGEWALIATVTTQGLDTRITSAHVMQTLYGD